MKNCRLRSRLLYSLFPFFFFFLSFSEALDFILLARVFNLRCWLVDTIERCVGISLKFAR